MAEQVHEAAREGLGTYKSAGPNLASSSVAMLTSAALVTQTQHLTVYVVTGPVYVENDGTDADANCLPLATNATITWTNSVAQIAALRFFAAAVYDIRLVLKK